MLTDKMIKNGSFAVSVLHHYDLYHEIVEFDRIKIGEYLKVSCGFVLYQLQ